MRIAVIGRGDVGGTLGRRLAGAGHEVTFGVRSPDREDEAAVGDAVADAEAVILAVPWSADDDVLGAGGPRAGRLGLDCTTPLRRGPEGLDLEGERSAARRIQGRVPGASVFKVFNTVGYEIMADPVVGGRPAMMPFCGDDPVVRERVRGLVADVGFDPVDVGGLESARSLECLALFWITAAARGPFGREFAFGVLRP